MDADLWSARMSATKRHQAIQSLSQRWEYLSIDDFDGEEDIRLEFACPYCNEELEIAALCSHLEEHIFEPKGVACPVCALKVTKDMVGHINTHHGHLFKLQRRRRFRRPSGSTLSLFSKEFREEHMQMLTGDSEFSNCNNTTMSVNNATDSLLKSLDSSKHGQCSIESNVIAGSTHKPSLQEHLSVEEREQKLKHETKRAAFFQQLVVAAMLEN